MTPRTVTALGFLAAFLTLVVNPVFDALGALTFVMGLLVGFVAPLVLAVVAAACGVRVRRAGDPSWGNRVIASAALAYVLAVVYGLNAVF